MYNGYIRKHLLMYKLEKLTLPCLLIICLVNKKAVIIKNRETAVCPYWLKIYTDGVTHFKDLLYSRVIKL
jgi:hypothetical protein